MRLTLFVAGDTSRSAMAVQALERLRALYPELLTNTEVVDVTRHPERADAARILTTPTLVREAPEPARRVTGDLGDVEQVRVALGLPPNSRHEERA